MDTTFITIHDLTPEARILYSSDSIVDILGYSPEEVINRPTWDFFHPEELPLAKAKHGRGVELDKAAVLSYCRMRDRDGRWVGCEVVFTVVYDVLVSCTSIYTRGMKSQSRAAQAPAIRRLFSNSPKDPRYHMLSHLSSKFTSPPKRELHEPRAALFLNRYTRTLTIMYATNGLADLLGISGEEMRGRSFYYCIQENCLPDAVRSLENAKVNDSIAYLRFWFRDPREEEHPVTSSDTEAESQDYEMEDVRTSGDETDTSRSVAPASLGREESDLSTGSQSAPSRATPAGGEVSMSDTHLAPTESVHRASSGESSEVPGHEAVFGEPEQRHSSATSTSLSPDGGAQQGSRRAVELEAVISCTSDGLVVCLRQATTGGPVQRQRAEAPAQTNGIYAVPWSNEPVLPPREQRAPYAQPTHFAPGLTPAQAFHKPIAQEATQSSNDFMNTIRDIAVFAWAVVGINGSLASYGRGQPRGEAQPSTGLPVWKPEARQQAEDAPHRPPEPTAPHLVDGVEGAFGHFRQDPGINNYYGAGSAVPQRPEPYLTSHMVDGVEGVFGSENKMGAEGARTSGFGFGDPGLGVGDRTKLNKTTPPIPNVEVNNGTSRN